LAVETLGGVIRGRLSEDLSDLRLSKPLHGTLSGRRSSRIGELRVMYDVSRERVLVTIVRIGPRGDVYGG
jgi:mRNA-degrading endonuclease RelE of RelBE toxin-antitoxin system